MAAALPPPSDGEKVVKRILLPALLILAGCSATPVEFSGIVVDQHSATRYLANSSDPGIGMSWIEPDFDEQGWSDGRFGVGGEWGSSGGVRALVESRVPEHTWSIYTRTPFEIPAVSAVKQLFFGVDYDDGVVVWINGTEVFRSDSMPRGTPSWNSSPDSHESSNGASPIYDPLIEITEVARPALRDGENLLAVGVWNKSSDSGDLVVVPKLLINPPLGVLVTRGPYLQVGTSSGVTVRWRTDKPTDSRVWYGERAAALEQAQTVAEPTTEHRVRLGGLKASTRYFYAVGASQAKMIGGDALHSFRTAPAPGSHEPTRFWVMGDSGTGGYTSARVRAAFEHFSIAEPPDFLLLLGDNAYKHGSDEDYQRAFFIPFGRQLASLPAWSTVGNHESAGSVESPGGTYNQIFDIPSDGAAGGVPSGSPLYFSFDHGRAHFVSLNSESVDRSPNGPMLDWLRRDLAASTADWNIVFWHHAPYPTGRRTGSTDPSIVEMRTNVLPILDEFRVDLVLNGHTHAYERSFLIHGHYGEAADLRPEMILDGGDGAPYRKRHAPHGGIVYVVMGSSGEALRETHENPALYTAMNDSGSLIVEIDGNRLTSRFIDVHLEVADAFTIEKELPAH